MQNYSTYLLKCDVKRPTSPFKICAMPSCTTLTCNQFLSGLYFLEKGNTVIIPSQQDTNITYRRAKLALVVASTSVKQIYTTLL